MTEQLEMTEIIKGVPTKYVTSTFRGHRVRVPVQAVRRTCELCGEEYWAWPQDFDWTCTKCEVNHIWGGEHD